jgi:hypothetical protein
LFLQERIRKTRKMARTEFSPALLGTDKMPTREKRAGLTFETPLDMGLRLEQYISSFREGRKKLDKDMPIHFPPITRITVHSPAYLTNIWSAELPSWQ